MVKRNLIAILGIFLVNLIFGQSPHSEYFTVSLEDEVRWKTYTDYINNSQENIRLKADSILKFAQVEYRLQQFSKVRELCELALRLNPNLGEVHNLIGKSYVSSAKLCNENGEDLTFLNVSFIWLAIDEWELALSKALVNKDQVLLYIEKYSLVLPERGDFHRCFGNPHPPSPKEGDEYYVGCWIQKNTRYRFRKE